MERVYDESLITEDFVTFLQQNHLYTNGPTLFKILEDAITKHATASQRLKHFTKDYLQKTFTSLFERFEHESPNPSSPPIVYSLPPAFPIRQVTRLPIRTPSDAFWIKTRLKLDAFLNVFWNLPATQQQILDTEDNFHFGLNLTETDNCFWIYDGFFGVTFGQTFTRYCGTNRCRFIFKQPSIKTLGLMFDRSYTPRKKKDKDKFMSFLSIYRVYELGNRFFSFGIRRAVDLLIIWYRKLIHPMDDFLNYWKLNFSTYNGPIYTM
ncbi:hypothetical protein RhiirA4_471485 [Rhizophagus irregularis]|uniref:Uncharacterized protein n=1 Tax=Rhizophagus irregularis TaxID=588596 RepID=A0A2I1H394_9GLOM|nr:hypothetical protein RhiirA4_471485 [Rhizophagus irregularis]